MALASVFQPAPAKTANLSGPFTPIQAGGDGLATTDPANPNAPTFTLAQQTTGPLDAISQGMHQGQLAGPLGLNDSTTGKTAINLAGVVPFVGAPIAMANTAGKAFGGLTALMTYLGVDPNAPNTMDLNGPITGPDPGSQHGSEGHQSLAQGLQNSIDLGVFSGTPTGRGDSGPGPNGSSSSGTGPGTTGVDAGVTGEGTGTSGTGNSGTGATGTGGVGTGGVGEGAYDTGGRTPGKRGQHSRITVEGNEEVMRPEAVQQHGATLDKWNAQSGGLKRVFAKGGAHGMA